jgi:hypothetical protein
MSELEGPRYTTSYIESLHNDRVWQAIWDAIKGWDISRTGGSYHGPTGDDVTSIYEAVQAALTALGQHPPLEG